MVSRPGELVKVGAQCINIEMGWSLLRQTPGLFQLSWDMLTSGGPAGPCRQWQKHNFGAVVLV